MKTLLAIDPGVKALGWARFRAGFLFDAGLLRAKTVQEMIEALRATDWKNPDAVIVERPQVYVGAAQDPNDLVALSLLAGAAAAASGAKEIDFVFPRVWKGQVPKDVHHKRIRNTLTNSEDKLLAAVKAPPSLRHNVLDAVGLGLWKIGSLR